MYITAQGCRLRNDLSCDLSCVEWDVKPYYTIPYLCALTWVCMCACLFQHQRRRAFVGHSHARVVQSDQHVSWSNCTRRPSARGAHSLVSGASVCSERCNVTLIHCPPPPRQTKGLHSNFCSMKLIGQKSITGQVSGQDTQMQCRYSAHVQVVQTTE